MNIFVLDYDPAVAASYHCDKHVVKMILESCQILCTVASMYKLSTPYRPTHKIHPCVRWAASEDDNWYWLHDLTEELLCQYSLRYHKIHACSKILPQVPKPTLPNKPTSFVQCMPAQYKCDDTVTAYRNYYIGEKRHILKYTNVETPSWIPQELMLS